MSRCSCESVWTFRVEWTDTRIHEGSWKMAVVAFTTVLTLNVEGLGKGCGRLEWWMGAWGPAECLILDWT